MQGSLWNILGIYAMVLFVGSKAQMSPQGRILNPGYIKDGDLERGSQWNEETSPPIPEFSTPKAQLAIDPSESIMNVLANPRIRGPLAVLVDTDSESLSRAQQIWEDVLDNTRFLTSNVILLAFNESEHERTLVIRNVENFRQAIASLPQSKRREDGKNEGAVFLTVLKATQKVPLDSAVLLFTSRPPQDSDLAQLAIQTLIRKRCRLYVWWSAKPNVEHLETVRLFQEVTEKSGGSFFHTYERIEPYDDDEDPDVSYPSVNKTILAVRREATQLQEIPIYLDSTVLGLSITIVGNVTKITLQPPGGKTEINLQDPLDLRSVGAQLIHKSSGLVELFLDTSASFPGVWKLTITGDGGASAQDDAQYDVIVEGYSRLEFSPVNFDPTNNYISTDDGNSLVFNVEGNITNITGVAVLDHTGREVKPALYTQDVTTRRPDGTVSLELQVPSQELPTEPFYLQVRGHDVKGEQFARLAYVQSSRYQESESLMVEVGDSSNLFVLPGQTTKLYFRVTNNNSLPMQVQLKCNSKFSRFINVQPFMLYLQPYQTAVHVVTLQVPSTVPTGSIDTITFIAKNGFESVTVPVQLYISDKNYDNDKPTLQHSFQEHCKGIKEKQCYSKTWTVRATVQDRNSGLLNIKSQPHGIRYDSVFTVGSKDPVKFTYSATCCDSKLDLYITDIQKNSAVYRLDAYDVGSTLSEGEIAAIVLGVIVLIIIIVVIVVVIVKKRKHTHTFQTHQTPR